ncbi:MAG: tRNA preQ1(34) S-adenosylmethionine ribosyltransferase-isomerase QueA [Candidatus Coatesbacteria bacterium]|nr:tRNA preQ1(34) S-adenosylmethionine ribosyltransferase-isomerase QueA [Candidatus Coatesbacteria bacterium]
MKFELEDFDYNLPEELIAFKPLYPRDNARLMILAEKTGHNHFNDLPEFLLEDSVMVINKTKVLLARLFGEDVEGRGFEFLLLPACSRFDDFTFEALAKPRRKIKLNSKILFTDEIYGEVISFTEDGILIRFNVNGYEIMNSIGHVPLPPYIRRKDEIEDRSDYQTIFAKVEGSVASPTAGLHFDSDLIERIKNKGIKIVEIILHVGLGTFKPLTEETFKKNSLHSEYFEIPEEAAIELDFALMNRKKVISVGTTTVRALETWMLNKKKLSGETDLFIKPGFNFKIVSGLITNFHLPKSSLLMLVCSFGGYARVLSAYKEAIEKRYRFYSYGDGMLIYP